MSKQRDHLNGLNLTMKEKKELSQHTYFFFNYLLFQWQTK